MKKDKQQQLDLKGINIYGASGHAKVVINILKLNKINISAIFDDKEMQKNLFGNKILLFSDSRINSKTPFILTIGSNKIREKLSKKLSKYKFSTAIHPSAIIDKTSNILEGTVIMAGVAINSSVRIGKHCIINTSSSIDHDCNIADFVHISPNSTLCGNVNIGKGTHVGAGSVIIQGITVGKNVIIGAGSVIINDIPNNITVAGNPGKIIKSR